jgi:thiamine-phosphate pyrophosphorylase
MELGEAGAVYVAFGIPANVQDREGADERRLALISWWSELFGVPCVAFNVATADEAHRLAEAGADFVSLTVSSADDAREAAARVRRFLDALPVGETAR